MHVNATVPFLGSLDLGPLTMSSTTLKWMQAPIWIVPSVCPVFRVLFRVSLTTLWETQMPNWRGLLDLEPIDKFLYDPASSILVLTLKTNLLEAWSSWQVLKWPLLTVIVFEPFDGFWWVSTAFWRRRAGTVLTTIESFRRVSTAFDEFQKT